MDAMETIQFHDKVVDVIRTCYDPEIPVNIYELGLIYDVKVEQTGDVHVTMTLTSPACPAAGTLPGEVEDKIRRLGAKDVKIEVVEPHGQGTPTGTQPAATPAAPASMTARALSAVMPPMPTHGTCTIARSRANPAAPIASPASAFVGVA